MQAAQQSQDDQLFLDGKPIANVSSGGCTCLLVQACFVCLWAACVVWVGRQQKVLPGSRCCCLLVPRKGRLQLHAHRAHADPRLQVTIVGKIVSVEEQQLMMLYTIDDGTGRVLAKYWTPDNDDEFVSVCVGGGKACRVV